MDKKLANKLGINVEINPWMFRYERLGWSYKPTNKDQQKFFEDNVHHHPDKSVVDWIRNY